MLIVDTYLSILKPNLSHLCYKHPMSTRIICGLTWLVCILSVSPVFYHASTFAVPNSDINHCDLMWHGPSREGYIWFTIIFAFVLPTLVKILLAIPLIYTLAGGSNSENASEGQYQVFAERNKRSAHLILTVIMFHILCWLPLWISLISVNLLPMNEMPDNSAILFHMISGCLGISCTVLSPLIYFKLSPEFRNGLHELMQSFSYYYCAKSQIFPAAENASGGMGINGKSASGAGSNITADDSFVNNFFPSNVFQQYDEERGQQTARQTSGQQAPAANGQQPQLSNRQANTVA